jgi:5-(carboxyamino)imidazole ribonucleotide mutase
MSLNTSSLRKSFTIITFKPFYQTYQKIKIIKMPDRGLHNTPETTTLVGIIMGSDSDLPVMKAAADVLKDFGIAFELTVVSAHRTPLRMVDYAKTAKQRGLKVIIAGAGGAAHLPGMVAAITPLPVIGVPVKSSNSIDGWDSILSILQMPNGVPVATVELNAAKNAGILAAKMIALSDKVVSEKLVDFMNAQEMAVLEKIKSLSDEGWPNDFDKRQS